MIIVSILSLVISLFLIFQMWKSKDAVTERLVSALTAVSETLATTEEGLVVVNDTLGNASTSINALSGTTLTLADNVDKTSTTIDSFSTLFTEQIPQTISNTQTAIVSAQTSAAVIDGVLVGLSAVPLVGLDYDPETSLSTSLGVVAESLNPLPGSIKGIGDDLSATSTSLTTLESDIQNISTNVATISENLLEAQDVVKQYQKQINQLQATIEQSIEQLPGWINIAVWGLTFTIFWLMVAQAGLLAQGYQLIKPE
jgi:septal ring factor EnvC (AmiA/AmiB activator)